MGRFREELASALLDLDPRLPKSRGRCFDIGMWGGCGPACGAFQDGECPEPQEIGKMDVIAELGEEDATAVFEKYPCFSQEPKP